MNFKKINFVLLIALGIFSIDMQAMNAQNSNTKKVDTHQVILGPKVRQKQKQSQTRLVPALIIISFLTQLGSIYSIDSTNSRVIGILAKARALLGSTGIYFIGSDLYNKFNKPGLTINFYKGTLVVSLLARIYRIFLDYKNWNTADSIALKNGLRKNDNNLNKMKLFHLVWMIINYFGPQFLAKFKKITANQWYCMASLLTLSEIFRQHLMYGMIANPKK